MNKILIFSLSLIFSANILWADNFDKGKYNYDHKMYSQALPYLQSAAKEGYGEACYLLGNIYMFGLEISPNYEIAMRMYKRGLEYGYHKGEAELGLMYEHGHGVEKNPTKALSYYRESAAKGISNGYYFLGQAYYGWEGLDTDSTFYCMSNIKQKDSEDPLTFPHWYSYVDLYLGRCYEYGLGTNADITEAAQYYEKSTLPSEVYRAFELNRLNGLVSSPSPFEAIRLGYDDPKAFYQLYCANNGFSYLEKAAKAGYGPAQRAIAECYDKGINVSVNRNKANEYNKLADKWFAKHGEEYEEEQRIESDVEYRNSKGIYRKFDIWKDIKDNVYLVLAVDIEGHPKEFIEPKPKIISFAKYEQGLQKKVLSSRELEKIYDNLDSINKKLADNGVPGIPSNGYYTTNYTTGSVVWALKFEQSKRRGGNYIEKRYLSGKNIRVMLKISISELQAAGLAH